MVLDGATAVLTTKLLARMAGQVTELQTADKLTKAKVRAAAKTMFDAGTVTVLVTTARTAP